jgi:phenylpyruvate tautomerase PptA (4-oxalocrotonate tautomerase family)
MLDAYIPESALDATAENQLLSRLTDILLECEGIDPSNPAARALAWVFLHRPITMFVAGNPTEAPHYKIIASVPEGQLDNERRTRMVAAVTNAVLDAEPEDRERDPKRVWVFTHQVPEGTWGGAGRVFSLADIASMILQDQEAGKAHAKTRLAKAKAERDAVFE